MPESYKQLEWINDVITALASSLKATSDVETFLFLLQRGFLDSIECTDVMRRVHDAETRALFHFHF